MQLHSNNHHCTAEFFLQEESEIISSSWVWEQLSKTERPPLHTHFSWCFHTVTHTHTDINLVKSLSIQHKLCLLASGDSLGHVQGPVGDIISEPRVAGKTLGEERIMAAVGSTVLHYPATKGTNRLLNMFSDIYTLIHIYISRPGIWRKSLRANGHRWLHSGSHDALLGKDHLQERDDGYENVRKTDLYQQLIAKTTVGSDDVWEIKLKGKCSKSQKRNKKDKISLTVLW